MEKQEIRTLWNTVSQDGGGKAFEVHVGDHTHDGYISAHIRARFLGDDGQPSIDVGSWSRTIKSADAADVAIVAEAWKAAAEAVESWYRSHLFRLHVSGIRPDDGEPVDFDC